MKKLAVIVISTLVVSTLLTLNLPAKQRSIRVKARTVDGSTKELQLYTGYYALMIGCGDYTDSMIPDLPNAVKDIKELAKVLKRMGFEVKTVLNPKSYKIEEAFNRLIAGVGRERGKAILVYFAGHGETLIQADGIKLGYILPVDTPHPERDYVGFLSKAVSMKRIDEVSRLIQSKHVLMLFDSCFSGALFAAVRDLPKYITEKTTKPVREYITAGAEDEKVPDESIFKRVFLQGLQDRYADLNRDGYITGLELGMYISDKVVQYSNGGQHPQVGKINHPALDKGDFVFALKTPSQPSTQITVAPPPRAKLGDYDKLIQERKATKRKWTQWQTRMEEDFAKAERYGQSPDLTPWEKSEVWASFLSSCRSDNPYSTKDDELREKAQKRLRHWTERKRLKTEKRKLEMAKLPPEPKYTPSVSKPNEIARDDPFIAYENGTVTDTRTGLMWAAKDNGKNIDWHDARRYCENYRGGGYSDWRMPTQDELASLYDPNKRNWHGYYITTLIDISNYRTWASETRGSEAASFSLYFGSRLWRVQSYSDTCRALPVRGGR